MAQIVTCPPASCKTILSSACVFYEGPSLIYTGIKTNDSIEVVIQKIDEYLNVTLPGIGSDQISFEKDVFQIAHGLSVGQAIRNDGTNWVPAQADTLANSGTVGIVSDVFDTNNFTYQFGGHLDGTYTKGVSYFLSKTVAGEIVPEQAPYTEPEVREFIGTGTDNGQLLIELDLGDWFTGAVPGGGGGGASNNVTSYRSSFESDSWVYAGYLLNLLPVITKTKDGAILSAQSLTDLETDWANRLTLTYV